MTGAYNWTRKEKQKVMETLDSIFFEDANDKPKEHFCKLCNAPVLPIDNYCNSCTIKVSTYKRQLGWLQ